MLPRIIRKVAQNINPKTIYKWLINFIKTMPARSHQFKLSLIEYSTFLLLFCVFLVNLPIIGLLRMQALPNPLRMFLLKVNRTITMFVMKYDKPDMSRMNRLELFELAFRNMTFKKTRTIITVGGMALGVGAIVFLVSIGYGLQQLVIERVARLDEMRQADVSVQPGSNVKLGDKAVSDFKEIKSVQSVLPLIGVVSKVNYQGSNSDVAVYGVTTDYLKNSAIKTSRGGLFNSNDIGLLGTPEVRLGRAATKIIVNIDQKGDVAGARAIRADVKLGQEIQDVSFSIFPGAWLRVRKSPTLGGEVLGFTRRVEGINYGKEYWGQSYFPETNGKVVQTESGIWLGQWIKSTVYLWEEKECDIGDGLCIDGKYVPIMEEGHQKQTEGYFAELEVMVNSANFDPDKNTDVLGLSTEDLDALAQEVLAETTTGVGESTLSAGDPDGLANVDDQSYIDALLNQSSASANSQIKKVSLPPDAIKEAVVNEAFLKVLGLDAGDPIGKEFGSSFVVTSNLLDDSKQKVESESANYKIVGVIPGDNSPFFYVPLSDLKHLGVTSYSQVKVIAETQLLLQDIRDKIGTMGFITSSVVDTVSQINALFGTVRIILGLIGAVALGVASLGMFNTLTVSLLERTREVGLMKAMGMTSIEVKRLFLTESMLMGFMGGVLGILSGFLGGKAVSLLLSIFGLMKGVGFIDVAYLPTTFVLLVFGLSLFVGVITGYYPSKRATKISALDALRYE